MPVLNITVGAVNITNYLIVTVAKSATPLVEETRQVFAPASLVDSFNVSITVADAAVYRVSWFESTDGTTLGQQLGASTWDAKLKIPIAETRYYLTNGSRAIDPAEGQNILADPYLDGKTIVKVVKDIVSLVPPEYSFKQYDLHAGGGIELLGGQVFNDQEITAVDIVYLQSFETSTSNAGMYDGWVKLTANTTLSNTHRNKRLKCEGSGSTLTITLESLASVPDGKFYYFNCNGGTAKKVKIACAGTDKIMYRGVQLSEICIGKGEHVRLEKITDGSSFWEVIDPHHGISMVGERVFKGVADSFNVIPEDGRYIDGNEEPRLYGWVNSLPSIHKIVTSADLSGTYTHPSGEEGQFAINTTLKQLRMPNTQGWYIKGIDDYVTGAAGLATEGQVGPHAHTIGSAKRQDTAGGNQSNTLYNGTDNGAVPFGVPISTDNAGEGIGADNEVRHIGEIFLRRS